MRFSFGGRQFVEGREEAGGEKLSADGWKEGWGVGEGLHEK